MEFKRNILAATLLIASASASAAIISAPTSLGNELNLLSKNAGDLTVGTAFTDSYDIANDQWNPDEQWTLSASGSGSAVMMFELAGNANTNTFGIYDLNNSSVTLEIFSGPDSNSSAGLGGGQSALSVLSSSVLNSNIYFYTDIVGFTDATIFSSSNFGFYLSTASGTFYSEAAKNTNGDDQLATFRGNDALQMDANNNGVFGTFTSNNYILAWEDIAYASSDKDFNDMVIMIESLTPVSEPGSLALLGLGLAGLGAARRRQTKA